MLLDGRLVRRLNFARPKSWIIWNKKEIDGREDVKHKLGVKLRGKEVATPMEENLNITSTEGKEFEDATNYRQLVWNLNFLTTTRSEISFVVGTLSRFM